MFSVYLNIHIIQKQLGSQFFLAIKKKIDFKPCSWKTSTNWLLVKIFLKFSLLVMLKIDLWHNKVHCLIDWKIKKRTSTTEILEWIVLVAHAGHDIHSLLYLGSPQHLVKLQFSFPSSYTQREHCIHGQASEIFINVNFSLTLQMTFWFWFRLCIQRPGMLLAH